MNAEFIKYSCQVKLPGFAEAGQLKLQQARVLIVGAGGLGCPVAQYLTGAGVGKIGIADFDVVSLSNLHRQILYTPMDVGAKKASVAANRLQEQNPDIEIVPHVLKIGAENVMEIISRYDIVVDGTDNFDTKYLLNDACVLSHKPLVYGAIYQFEGQAAIWNVPNKDGSFTPHYRDLFPEVDAAMIPDCAEGGVIPTLAGIIGCIQANEVIKMIVGNNDILAGKLLIFDALTMLSRVLSIGKVSSVPVRALPKAITVPQITVLQLRDCVIKNSVELIDVRTAEERREYNIGGWHLPLQEVEQHYNQLNIRKPAVVYCGSGKRSDEAVKIILKKNPDAHIYSLTGGVKAWRETFS
jgi:sulfur-carrier protein adenylyltransferase/sulfurtransferase